MKGLTRYDGGDVNDSSNALVLKATKARGIWFGGKALKEWENKTKNIFPGVLLVQGMFPSDANGHFRI